MSSLLLLCALLLPGDLEGARKALEAGNPRDALQLLGDLAEGSEASPEALAVAGRAYAALAEYGAASEALLRASLALPDDGPLARDAGWACYRAALADGGIYASAYLADALRAASRAKDPLLLGAVLEGLDRAEEALAAYRESEGGEALEGRARCLALLGREEEARKAWQAALEAAIARTDLSAAYRCAFAADRGGRLLAWLDGLLEAKAGDPRLLRYRGFARARLLLYQDAVSDLRALLTAIPYDAEAKTELLGALLQLYHRRRDPAMLLEAETVGLEVLRDAPWEETTRRGLSYAAGQRFARAEYSRALLVLEALHASDPADVDSALNLGAIARRLGRYDIAHGAYERALEAYPEDSAVLNDLAILVDGEAERTAARALWAHVLELQPEALDSLENLYTDRWEQGDREGVAAYVSRGLEAARKNAPEVVERWRWFRDRELWSGVPGN
ncbi:MAG: tetratricopeptide repeat protein [Planctomycetaceae bacterium]